MSSWKPWRDIKANVLKTIKEEHKTLTKTKLKKKWVTQLIYTPQDVNILRQYYCLTVQRKIHQKRFFSFENLATGAKAFQFPLCLPIFMIMLLVTATKSKVPIKEKKKLIIRDILGYINSCNAARKQSNAHFTLLSFLNLRYYKTEKIITKTYRAKEMGNNWTKE